MPRMVLKNVLVMWLSLIYLSGGHTIDQVYMEFYPEERAFKGLLFVDAAYCLPEYRGDDGKAAPDREWLLGLSEKEHARLQVEAEKYIHEVLLFMQDEAPVTYVVSFPDYASQPYSFYKSLVQSPILRVAVEGEYLPQGGSLQAEWKDQFDANLLVEILWEENGEKKGNTLTIEPDVALDLGVQIPEFWNEIPVEGEEEEIQIKEDRRSWWQFVKIGFDHIVPMGLDHIVFVIGLFLFSPRWRPLLHQSLIFTVAHSVTLALALLGIINFPGKWVEILIALSIVYIAVENLVGKEMGKRRLVLVFFFGLLHGLGFGAVLNEFLPKERIALPLVGFNVGVELGQILVLLVCFVTIGHFKESFRWIRLVGSLIIGAVGLYWVVERLMG